MNNSFSYKYRPQWISNQHIQHQSHDYHWLFQSATQLSILPVISLVWLVRVVESCPLITPHSNLVYLRFLFQCILLPYTSPTKQFLSHLNKPFPTQSRKYKNLLTIHQHISPFIPELHEYKMPTTTKLPHFKIYNSTTCPNSHIYAYEWHMQSLKLDKRIRWTHFQTTLDGNARAWFKRLAPNNIRSFFKTKRSILNKFHTFEKISGRRTGNHRL